MNALALTVAIACAGASIALAAWVWLAVNSAGRGPGELIGHGAIRFDS